MKMMQGACFLAWSNMSRTREAPTPTNISTKSEPEIEKNGTLASPAMALASSVLPVPGEPTISTPRGMWPPSFWNLPGLRRNSTSSPTSSLASSTPATSSNVTLTWSSPCSLARLLPNDIAPRPPAPPPCIWRMKYTQTPISNRIGATPISRSTRIERSAGGSAENSTLFSTRSSTSLSSGGPKVLNSLPSAAVPVMLLPLLVLWTWTSTTSPFRTFDRNCEYESGSGVVPTLA